MKIYRVVVLLGVAYPCNLAAGGETRGGGPMPAGMNDFMQRKVDAGTAIDFVAFTSKGAWVACSR